MLGQWESCFPIYLRLSRCTTRGQANLLRMLEFVQLTEEETMIPLHKVEDREAENG